MTLSRDLVRNTDDDSCSLNGVKIPAICVDLRSCTCRVEPQNTGLISLYATFEGVQLMHQMFIEIVNSDSEFELIPTYGSSHGGSLVTLIGTQLSNVSVVFIGGLRSDTFFRTEKHIVAMAPALESNRTHSVSVFNPVVNSFTRSSDLYLSLDEPRILKIMPSVFPAIEASITITASNLFLSISKCIFGDDAAVFGRFISTTLIYLQNKQASCVKKQQSLGI